MTKVIYINADVSDIRLSFLTSYLTHMHYISDIALDDHDKVADMARRTTSCAQPLSQEPTNVRQ